MKSMKIALQLVGEKHTTVSAHLFWWQLRVILNWKSICWYIGLIIDIMDTYYCSISSYISSGLYGHWYSLCPYVTGISIIQHMFNINFAITTNFVISMSFTYFMFVLWMCLQTPSPFCDQFNLNMLCLDLFLFQMVMKSLSTNGEF